MRIFPPIDMNRMYKFDQMCVIFYPRPSIIFGTDERDTVSGYLLSTAKIPNRGSSVIAPLSKNNKAMP